MTTAASCGNTFQLMEPLSRFPACPICGGEQHVAETELRGETGFYVRTTLESANLPSAEIIPQLVLHRCTRCSTIWYDPWFKPGFMARGYGYLVGRHKHGWAALRAWTQGERRDYLIGRPRIWKLIQALLPDLRAYGEVNCPFSGLFYAISEDCEPAFDRHLVSEKIKTLASIYASTDFKREYADSTALRSLGVRHTRAKDIPIRVLIDEPSPLCWGPSCIFAGANCRALALDLLIDRIESFDNLNARGPKLDAVGFFNTLDHFIDPLAVLAKAVRSARLVIVDLHPWGWTDAQHLYSIGPGFPDLLRDRGLSAVDISRHVTESSRHGDERRYYLVSSAMRIDQELASHGYSVAGDGALGDMT